MKLIIILIINEDLYHFSDNYNKWIWGGSNFEEFSVHIHRILYHSTHTNIAVRFNIVVTVSRRWGGPRDGVTVGLEPHPRTE